MKIAQIAPLAESVPPKFYGGTERIVSYLTEELVRQGHDVTLFASGDSQTNAELVPITDMALRLNPGVVDTIPYHMMMLEQVRRRADEFDALHFHIDLLHLPMVQDFIGRTVTTLHGRLDLPDLPPFYRAFPEHSLVSISDHQRLPMPPVNWGGTIYHGLPADLLTPRLDTGDGYLAFLGRISPEKRPDRAIRIAARSGRTLRIAAKIDAVDRGYWESEIAPLVDRYPNVEYIGEINEQQKAHFLGQASALLFPIDWPEPFGLVMIEAMACATPVIAFRCGSVPEVIEHGVSGFIVDSEDDAVAAVASLSHFDRSGVRAAFDARFTAQRMASDYVELYRGLPGARTDAARLRRLRGEEAELQIVA
ncbi:glycosyltransferase family 4 protein [Sphingobium sp. YR768]|uniref:glycosyltransferase family 4 protein n=1 Tax=Sphingobium sp. YR768 TaxID=1884365 RepID=UPI0008D479D0|nr:glycosyltransferase family 4 protein [Sphingobium sp. YR768]SER96441.1 Glycosyltransferase involved in cell wall bisynthesis [Sphingobium sp. YR768]